MKIQIEDLEKAVSQIMEEEVQKDIDEINDRAAEFSREAVDELKRTSPRSRGNGGRLGHYADGWKMKKEGSNWTGINTMTIYNEKKSQITHLLENGHLKAGGQERVRATPHIKPVEDNLFRKLNNIGG